MKRAGEAEERRRGEKKRREADERPALINLRPRVSNANAQTNQIIIAKYQIVKR